jgi:hypothetical protein
MAAALAEYSALCTNPDETLLIEHIILFTINQQLTAAMITVSNLPSL